MQRRWYRQYLMMPRLPFMISKFMVVSKISMTIRSCIKATGRARSLGALQKGSSATSLRTCCFPWNDCLPIHTFSGVCTPMQMSYRLLSIQKSSRNSQDRRCHRSIKQDVSSSPTTATRRIMLPKRVAMLPLAKLSSTSTIGAISSYPSLSRPTSGQT
ncbi:hypothetical protein FOVG_19854 [Fusarium oxysporum f. sp. pisi HDV247]|uniref:Uncharacterized protein n=1 Tax=Fusarium oxysporum f. sp. pisi HDV247 TaxID=1080344 RepID=W9N7D3_FUSOX|nr:hypothetical protein FOVG_19854 [Fusarium oxysporum f. sp. pisi HDV247]